MGIFSDSMLLKQSAKKLDVSKLFSTTLYTGDGASSRAIVNGLDLATNGGLVWHKGQDNSVANSFYDSGRGLASGRLASDTQNAQAGSVGAVTAFNSNGFNLSNALSSNISSYKYVAWSFIKSARFFDVLTWTGTSSLNRSIAHGLGVAPGLIIVKRTDTAEDWWVGHNSLTGGISNSAQFLKLNDTVAGTSGLGLSADATSITLDQSSLFYNAGGKQYVAYVFAHDTSSDGVVQCGGYTISGGADAVVNLGWEPQFVLWKPSSIASTNWRIFDIPRTWGITLIPNSTASELPYDILTKTSTGFTAVGASHPTNGNYVYMAIRKAGT
ncbi:DUF7483 domain-containing protein [Rhizobium oryzicola]|uniref:DUF7483 domain-containing protein n=1 Tax=Rhizobium oryzicola TaxID=1232668 RepID=A0ABT8SWM7_9HYPH|nr:hypothetical protein [Rhizobium oryzicola]MDO1582438.1 hypothetical protein [Rhizobium oryzicola]